MDLISTRTIDVTKLALDGLMTRQKAITANIANVMTPDYQRKDVNFESQLSDIIAQDDAKQEIKERNSIEYNPTAMDIAMNNAKQPQLSPQQANYLQTDIYGNYKPQIITDTDSGGDQTGNNVDIEKESMDMASVGLRYNVLAGLEAKQLKNVAGAIKGEM